LNQRFGFVLLVGEVAFGYGDHEFYAVELVYLAGAGVVVDGYDV
jgi:hypothetical protein